ncbi:MAG: signal peptidase I [Thermacetogeniaceae bacterium]
MLRRLWSDWVLPLLIAVALALVIRSYVAEARVIPSGSMEPTIQIGDRVIVQKLFFNPNQLRRGDVIVFWAPPGVSHGVPLIKRVIGLPGDRVEVRGGTVYVNGQPLNEPYIKAKPKIDFEPPVLVPPGNLFMMGDNRNNSFDSRNWGYASFSGAIGKADLIYWPLAHFGKINGEPG